MPPPPPPSFSITAVGKNQKVKDGCRINGDDKRFPRKDAIKRSLRSIVYGVFHNLPTSVHTVVLMEGRVWQVLHRAVPEVETLCCMTA